MRLLMCQEVHATARARLGDVLPAYRASACRRLPYGWWRLRQLKVRAGFARQLQSSGGGL